jgi:hypothetical protein
MTASSYRGLYVQKSNGKIHSVQVQAGLNSIPLPPHDYITRGVKPPIEQLPDEKEYFAQQNQPQ